MAYKLGEMDEAKRCLECGESIEYGRSDKKFCCEGCRNRYHNRENYRSLVYRRRVSRMLDRNYSVLSEMLKKGNRQMEMSELAMLGFNPSCFTYYRKSGKHAEYACYDILYSMSLNKLFNVRRAISNDGTNSYLCSE